MRTAPAPAVADAGGWDSAAAPVSGPAVVEAAATAPNAPIAPSASWD